MSEFEGIDLTGLSNDELAEFAGELADIYAEVSSDTVELSAEDAADVADVLAAIESVDTEIAARAAATAVAERAERVAQFAASHKAKAAEAVKEEEEEAPAAAPEAPAAVVEPEVELAAEIAPAGLKSDAASTVPAAPKKNKILVSSDVPGYRPGQELVDLAAVAEAFVAKRKGIRGTDESADGYQYLVASIEANFPEDRHLSNDVEANMAKIEAVAGPEAITASGGLCAPLEPYYTLATLGSAERPVKAALPNFSAERGGIVFMPPPRLTDLTGSSVTVTAGQDAAGYGTTAPTNGSVFKPSLKVACAAQQSVTVRAITRSLEFGNFGARTFPEQVQAWIGLSLTHHARRAEIELLDQIAAASTAVTAARTYGAARTLLPQVDQAVAAFKSRHRMSDASRFRCLMPTWAKSLLRSDLARMLNEPVFDVSDAQIEDWLSIRGINVSWYIDGATGAGQIFGAQSAGAILAYPSTVQWFLYPEGSFLFLDGGSLDLGIVRDSTLNSTNDYRIFAETFEAVAFVGVESLQVTSTVLANGAGPAAEAAITTAL
jgi:hypothetical protein